MIKGKGGMESEKAQPGHESMVLISDVVGSGIQTLTTPRLAVNSEAGLYKSQRLKNRNISKNMQTLGTISSKGE